MARRQKETRPIRVPTKRQLAKWERQRLWQRVALGIGIVFVVFVLAYAGYGYYTHEVKPINQVVIRVNDTLFDMGYYIETLRIYGKGQDPNQLSQIADVAIGLIQTNELQRQGAENLGISVGLKEIDAELKRLGLPTNRAHRDTMSAQLLARKLMTDYFLAQIPASGEQVRLQAMFLESEKVAREVLKRLEEGEDFGTVAKQLSLENETRSRGGDLGWLPKGFAEVLVGSSILENMAFSLEPGVLSGPAYDADFIKGVGYWLIEVVEKRTEEGVQVRAMLLGSEEEAEIVRARLDLGEDFAALAKLHSQHEGSKESGGDLGWIKPGMVGGVFDKVAFTLEPGKLSEPVRDETIQTRGGYWLVEILEKDANRRLDEKAREQLASSRYREWIVSLMETSVVESYIGDEAKRWAISRAF